MLSVIVPCYNEEKNIPEIVSKFDKIILDFDDEVEVILVNNGSTDNSKRVFKKVISNTAKNISVHNLDNNIGYGHGIPSGLKVAKGDVLSWTHADLQTEPKDVVLAFKEYKKHNDPGLVIKGKRKNRNLIDSFFTWGMQVYCTIILKIKLNDINAQPKMFSRDFYEKNFNTPPLDFSLDLYLLTKAKKIKTVDVFFHERKFGKAKGGGSWAGKWKLIKRTISYISKLNKVVN